MAWTRGRVESWLLIAHEVLRYLPDMEQRYLRNPLRSKFPEVVETSASAFAARVNQLQKEGRTAEADIPPLPPHSREIDQMEASLLGIPKPHLGAHNDQPWLLYLPYKRQRLVWRRVKGMPWENIAVIEKRSQRTAQRYYNEALEVIADELTTLEKRG